MDLGIVQELMGHKTITMTMKYAHLSPGHLMQPSSSCAFMLARPKIKNGLTPPKKKG